MKNGLNKFMALLPRIRQYSSGDSVINLHISFGLIKFLASLLGINDNFKDQYSNQKGIY